jgi:hypothetical protein
MARKANINSISELDKLLIEARGWGEDCLREYYGTSLLRSGRGNTSVAFNLQVVIIFILIASFPDVFSHEILRKEYGWYSPGQLLAAVKKHSPKYRQS